MKTLTKIAIINVLVEKRLLFSVLSILTISLIGYGIKNIYFNSDYHVFFKDDNPQLISHETIESTYTKADSLMIYLTPSDKKIFTKKTIQTIQEITKDAWQMPYSTRVDSLTNFQNSWAEGDELIVKSLVDDNDVLDDAFLAKIQNIALNEKQTIKRVISPDSRATLITISLDLPSTNDMTLSEEAQATQRMLNFQAMLEVMEKGEEFRQKLLASDPGMEVHLNGLPAINLSFTESSKKDISTLFPLMYLIIILLLALFLRSFGCVIGTVIVIGASTFSALGFAGWVGFSLNQLSVISPMVILTIAVCDCVHLLMIYLQNMSDGSNKVDAMKESLLINFQPIILTSITTAIGFVALNFSSSPPTVMLGNICCFGVLLAMVLTFTLLPFIVLLLTRQQKNFKQSNLFTSQIAETIIANPWKCLLGSLLASLLCISQINRNYINDDATLYFKDNVPLKQASNFADDYLPGYRSVAYSINCGSANCINEPNTLKTLEAFTTWFEQQNEVVYVSSYIDVIKKLNQNMNQGDPDFYQVPDSQELAAQYQLLYELSLPYGLDLNNLINIDKSASKVTVFIDDLTSGEMIGLDQSAQQWFDQNAPSLKTPGSSVNIMFSHIGEQTIQSMKSGSILAIIGITLTIFIALRSFKFGLISLLPNVFPAAIALGIWGMLIGTVNQAVALVFSMTLGIVVDNTVHFVSKYIHARKEKKQSADDSVRYAFKMVGNALIVTTTTLTIGFGLLATSSFNVNAYLGAMVAITIVVALIFDFLFLPSLLLLIENRKKAII